MPNLRRIGFVLAMVFLTGTNLLSAAPITSLIDVAISGTAVNGMTGFAATGITTNDFWNTYVYSTGALPNLEFVDGTPSGASLTVSMPEGNGEGGAANDGAIDAMYAAYLWTSFGYPIVVTVTNLSAGAYDFYLYGHGGETNQNSIFDLNLGSTNVGIQATTIGSAWDSPVWQEGVQDVEFTNVTVSSDEAVIIVVYAGAADSAYFSGLQMANLSPLTAMPFVVTQPESQSVIPGSSATFSVFAGGTAILAYQWFFNGAKINDATNSSYTVTNAALVNSGLYAVLVSNSFGSSLSSNAVLTILLANLSTTSPDQSLSDAYLTASITPHSENTTVWFEWGADTNYGHVTQPLILEGTNTWSISNLITGLTPYTTYYCQAVASNVFGTVLGGDVSFITVPRFVQVGTNADWSACALSGDGHEIVATLDAIVYISTNLGVTFTPTPGIGSVFAVSSNGTTILAYSGADSTTFLSKDRGATWITNTEPASFSRFAASSDCQTIVASDGSANVYTSTNFGATWSGNTLPQGASCLACSGDGSHLYAGAWILGADNPVVWIYGSENLGKTWTTVGTFGGLIGVNSVACSVDGLTIAVASEAIVISMDGGTSWTYSGNDVNFGPASIALSANGKTLIYSFSFGVQVSPDTGTTWYYANAPYSEATVMSSMDGKTLAAFNGAIYLSLPPANQSATLSFGASTSNGLPSFQLTGQPGYTYAIQASTNLVDWAEVALLVNTNGVVSFSDSTATNYTQRFYRAVAP